MLKQIMLATMVVYGAGCALEDSSSTDDQDEARQAQQDKLAKHPDEATPEAFIRTAHQCWSPSAGLNDVPSCGSEIEPVPQGRQLDVYTDVWNWDACALDYRIRVIHHASGHTGWIRVGAAQC